MQPKANDFPFNILLSLTSWREVHMTCLVYAIFFQENLFLFWYWSNNMTSPTRRQQIVIDREGPLFLISHPYNNIEDFKDAFQRNEKQPFFVD